MGKVLIKFTNNTMEDICLEADGIIIDKDTEFITIKNNYEIAAVVKKSVVKQLEWFDNNGELMYERYSKNA